MKICLGGFDRGMYRSPSFRKAAGSPPSPQLTAFRSKRTVLVKSWLKAPILKLPMSSNNIKTME
jgi:hypothetical protein